MLPAGVKPRYGASSKADGEANDGAAMVWISDIHYGALPGCCRASLARFHASSSSTG